MGAPADLCEVTIDDVRIGRFEVELRRSSVALLAAYVVAGIVTALAGGHLGVFPIATGAGVFVVLALAAALFHELGHALTALSFGRRPVRLVLKAGVAVQIEEARPGTRGARALAECLVAASGPLASVLIGLAYLNVSTSMATPFGWAGLLALIDGVINLVPLAGRSDGTRILQALTRS